jgi:predicted nucleic-acid-binding Zn-ribbon protein
VVFEIFLIVAVIVCCTKAILSVLHQQTLCMNVWAITLCPSCNVSEIYSAQTSDRNMLNVLVDVHLSILMAITLAICTYSVKSSLS